MGRDVYGCEMVCADIRERSDLFAGIETVVAVRSIYHLKDAIHDVFAAADEAGVKRLVLCGNPGRAKWPHVTGSSAALGEWNRYASVEGMSEVIARAGFTVDVVVREGDPIVTGRR